MNRNYSVEVDFIVIGLNEEPNLERCFVSINHALEEAKDVVRNKKIIYVDSGSTDGSVALAKNYADKIFKAESKASASTSRMNGLHNATGRFLMFMDGDMELCKGWLSAALRFMENNDAAGVTGFRDDIFIDQESGEIIGVKHNVYDVNKERKAPHFGGALLAVREDIISVGGYRPNLGASEEPDLYARLLANDKYVYEIPVPFINHYTPPPPRSLGAKANKIFNVFKQSKFFGRSFLYSIKEDYLKGFIRVFPATMFTWCLDVLSLIMLLWLRNYYFLVIQVSLLITLFIFNKRKIFLTARIRLVGVFFALMWVIFYKSKDYGNEVRFNCVK